MAYSTEDATNAREEAQQNMEHKIMRYLVELQSANQIRIIRRVYHWPNNWSAEKFAAEIAMKENKSLVEIYPLKPGLFEQQVRLATK